MPEDTRQSLGDGQDNPVQAVQQISKAIGEIGGKATANSVAGLVKAGAESGKAVWSMRHTLYKILICACLILLIFVILIVSLPTVVTNRLFGLDGERIDESATLLSAYTEMSGAVTDAIEAGYDAAMARVEKIISENGYDYDLSMDALIDYAKESAGFDTCYILAAYSASLEQKNISKADMIRKLNHVAESMFPVTYCRHLRCRPRQTRSRKWDRRPYNRYAATHSVRSQEWILLLRNAYELSALPQASAWQSVSVWRWE